MVTGAALVLAGEVDGAEHRQRAAHARPRDPRARSRPVAARSTLARERGDGPVCVRALNAVGTASWFAVPTRPSPCWCESLEHRRRLRDDIGVARGDGQPRLRGRRGPPLRDSPAAGSRRAVGSAPRATSTTAAHYASGWLARIALEQGEWDRARALAEPLPPGHRPDLAHRRPDRRSPRSAIRRGEPDASALLDAAWELAQRTGHLQRLWPVAAGRAEAAWSAGRPDRIPDLVAETLALAVRLDHPWAIGELGWWSVRARR